MVSYSGTMLWKEKLATNREVASWFGLSFLIASVMLVGVYVSSLLWGNASSNITSGLTSNLLSNDHSIENLLSIFQRNCMVLAIHFLACYVGAIIGRPHKPAHDRWGKLGKVLHRETPQWLSKFALAYAFSATAASVAVQVTGLGLFLNDIASAGHVGRLEMLLLTLPHALIELVAVFLPLALFLIVAKRGQLSRLSVLSWQSLAIALPLIMFAALIETFVTPLLIQAVIF